MKVKKSIQREERERKKIDASLLRFDFFSELMTVSVSFGAECQDGVALSNVDRSVCIPLEFKRCIWRSCGIYRATSCHPVHSKQEKISIPRSLYMRPLAAANGDNVVTRQREWRPRLALT